MLRSNVGEFTLGGIHFSAYVLYQYKAERGAGTLTR